MNRLWIFGLAWLTFWAPPAFNSLYSAGLVPPPGIEVPPVIRSDFELRLAKLEATLAELRTRPDILCQELLPDVAILHKAVHWALAYNEFHHTNQFALADQLLNLGHERAAQLQSGIAPWTQQTGLVIRGFRSRIDDSIQPYGVVIPTNWSKASPSLRLDVWLAGRDESRTELKFLGERLRSRGEFSPANSIVLHPYGRYCNAYKFAGETDVFEAVAHAEVAYGTDARRRSIRGFSMGGAGTWHLAAHHPGFWRAANPGAGFVDTAGYTGILKQPIQVAPWEQTLWQLYDVPGYAANFHHLDVIAYSGELDRQRLAADTMAAAMQSEGISLHHILGPGVEHRFEPGAKARLAESFDTLMATPKEIYPRRLNFTTPTLRYPEGARLAWFQILALENHWKPARVHAEVDPPSQIRLSLSNITAFRLMDPPELGLGNWHIQIGSQTLDVEERHRRQSPGTVQFTLKNGRWRVGSSLPSLRKQPGLQGPVDDAFMDRFLVVRPTGTAWNPAVGTWAEAALQQFIDDWRGQFRADLRLRNDQDLTPSDVAESHLILWGDPGNNRVLKQILRKLPLQWNRRSLMLGRIEIPASTHVPMMIFPNPLNPKRYIVLNSGHTFAAWKGTNARQTPWLPDWAVREINPRQAPQGIIAAGFFDERWQFR